MPDLPEDPDTLIACLQRAADALAKENALLPAAPLARPGGGKAGTGGMGAGPAPGPAKRGAIWRFLSAAAAFIAGFIAEIVETFVEPAKDILGFNTLANDPRTAKIEVSCSQLKKALNRAPPTVREHLATSQDMVDSLRYLCYRMLGRERELRAETPAKAIATLDDERDALERQLSGVTDEHVKLSLANAVAAITEQKRQRLLMARIADRLDAELTRLLWTIDGMAFQFVRLRAASAAVRSAPDAESARAMREFQDEINTIADALEEIAESQCSELFPVSHLDEDSATAPTASERERER